MILLAMLSVHCFETAVMKVSNSVCYIYSISILSWMYLLIEFLLGENGSLL